VCFSGNLYAVLEWQRVGARVMIQHYLAVDITLQVFLSALVFIQFSAVIMPIN